MAIAGLLNLAGAFLFIKSVRDQVEPGTSALFLTSDAVVDGSRSSSPGTHAQLIHTNLSNDQEQALRRVFGEE